MFLLLISLNLKIDFLVSCVLLLDLLRVLDYSCSTIIADLLKFFYVFVIGYILLTF
jgi:hypothetical protein